MLNNYICTVDIGSTKISGSVARVKKNRLSTLFFETIASKGVKRGAIVDSIELTGCLSQLLKSLKKKSGIRIKSVCVNISGEDITIKHSRAILPLTERGNKVITVSDIRKVNEQARILGSCLEEEIIHQMPFSYSIDSKNDIINPLGLYSHRLEVDLYLICAKMSSVQTLTRVVNQAGYEIKKMFFSGLATHRAVFGKELKEGLHVLCDIGSDVTEVLVFRDGLLKDVEILELGGNDLTFAISKELKIPFDLAEEVKKSHSSIGDCNGIQEDKEILIKMDSVYKPIKQKLVAEILTTKAKSMCQSIKETVEKSVAASQVDNFVTTGRVTMQDGFLEILENTLGIPVRLGRLLNPNLSALVTNADELLGQKYLTYITSLGMLGESLQAGDTAVVTQTSRNVFFKAADRIKEVYQEYF
jgi:cell division protein FtsA